jgi:integrating conjugative element protein (TIGR03757 family)
VRLNRLHMSENRACRIASSGTVTALIVIALSSVACLAWAQTPAAIGTVNVPVNVSVLTVATLPIVNADGANVYYVDGLTQLENIMSQALPKTEADAKAMLEQRLAAMGKEALQSQSRNAADGIAMAMTHRIERVPAIIFDGRAIVYGVTDVAAARRFYATWQQSLVPVGGVKK